MSITQTLSPRNSPHYPHPEIRLEPQLGLIKKKLSSVHYIEHEKRDISLIISSFSPRRKKHRFGDAHPLQNPLPRHCPPPPPRPLHCPPLPPHNRPYPPLHLSCFRQHVPLSSNGRGRLLCARISVVLDVYLAVLPPMTRKTPKAQRYTAHTHTTHTCVKHGAIYT
jgi:hypothetical protein